MDKLGSGAKLGKHPMHLLAVDTALPDHHYDQEVLREAALSLLGTSDGRKRAIFDRMYRRVGVSSRHLALPLEQYQQLDGFDGANEAWSQCAVQLGERAVADALRRAEIAPDQVDALFFTTVTGLTVPSVDADIVNRLGMRADVKRVPLFGLGCAGGAAGLARMHDYLRAWPDHVAVLLSVELCSLTLQRGDASVANAVASALFGDGVAAVVGIGAERARRCPSRLPEVVASRSATYPDTNGVMGWSIGSHGFRVVLSADVPDMVYDHVAPGVEGFLREHELGVEHIGSWVCHPGGPRVLQAFEDALQLPDRALESSWHHLQNCGNLSSASVLFVLRDTLENRRRDAEVPGMVLAMGPGFSSELLLFRW